jgi:hypothetical protein
MASQGAPCQVIVSISGLNPILITSLRCMEHAMHLGAKSLLQEICPNPQFKRSIGNGGGTNADAEDEASDGDDEDWVNAMQSEEPASEGEEVDEVEEFEPGDLLGKVLALITQVISWL